MDQCLYRAEEKGNVILLFDEAENIFSQRENGIADPYTSQLLSVGLNRIGDDSKFKVIVITNMPHQIDFAMRRRVWFQYCFRLPNDTERGEMFLSKLRDDNWKISRNFDVQDLIQKTKLFSGDDIQRLVERIVRYKAKESTAKDIRFNATPISNVDVVSHLEYIRPSVRQQI